MKRFVLTAALSVAALTLSSATIGSVHFETKPRAVGTGTFPQIGVRVTGDVSLLTVEGGDLWYLFLPRARQRNAARSHGSWREYPDSRLAQHA